MEINQLLTKYFSGNASPEELHTLEAWIAEKPENETEFMRMTQVFELSGIVVAKNDFKTDKAAAKEAFTSYMVAKKPEKHILLKPKNKLRIFFSAAAVIAVLVISTVVAFQFYNDNEIVLTAQNQTIDSNLPDATTVQLAANSQLIYKNSFAKSNKDIVLIGKARFEVGKSGKGQLRVFAGETMIEDIGTTFDVTSFDNSDFVQVKVSQGMVMFYTTTNKGIVVKACETAIYNKKTKQFRLAAKHSSKNNQIGISLNMDGLPLTQAIEIIENAYNIKITLVNKNYANEQITVSFANEKAETVLNILGQTLGLKVEKNSGNFVLIN
jgi:ferric-dicitrate binding protein FerR (iron transport regulator)